MKLLQRVVDTSLDDIMAWMQDPEHANPLTPKQQEELLYYEWADNLINRFGALNPTPALLLNKINRERELAGKNPIIRQTVYNYIANAQKLFGSVQSIDKPYWKSRMFQKEFERYLKALEIGDQKAAKGASQEMRHWGSIHVNEDDKINKQDLGEKNQILIINAGDKSMFSNLDDTFLMNKELLDKILKQIEQHNIDQMLDQLNKEAEDAEYTELDPE